MVNSKHRPCIAMPNPQKIINTERVPREPVKRKWTSRMWDFFVKLDDRYAECKACGLHLTWKAVGGQSLVVNLSKHHSSKHSNENQNEGVRANVPISYEETVDYEDDDGDGIPPPEPPSKKRKTTKSSPTKNLKKNVFSSRKKPNNHSMLSKPAIKPWLHALKAKKVAFSRSGKRSENMKVRTKVSGQKLKLGDGHKNEKITVELKKLTVQDLIQAKVKPKVIENYFGKIKLPRKPSSTTPPSRVASIPYQLPATSPLDMPMIEWKEKNKPKLLNTYNNIKTQGDMIEAMIKAALPTLQGDKVSQIYNFIVDMGVENVEDLAFVEVDDMNKVLKPIQSRKLVAAWKNKGVPNYTSQFPNQACVPAVFQIQNMPSENKVCHTLSSEDFPQSTMVQSIKIPGWQQEHTAQPSVDNVYPEYAARPENKADFIKYEAPLPLPAPKEWPDSFEIPWYKLPPEIMKCLSKKKRPNRTQRFQIIHTIVDDILKVSKNPTSHEIGKIGKKMMQKFPQSLHDEQSKKDCKKLVNQLLGRIKYLRKDDGKEFELPETDEKTESPEPNSTPKLKACLSSERGTSATLGSKSFSSGASDLSSSGRASTASGEFHIPWHKMSRTLLDTLNTNGPLIKNEKEALVAIVIDEYILWNPKPKNVKADTTRIAREMCEIYPLSLSDMVFGKGGGSQYASSALSVSLYTRVNNVRRGVIKHYPIRESTSSKEICPLDNSVESLCSSLVRGTPTKLSDSACSSVGDCSLPTNSNRGEFAIPWHKLDETLLDALNKNKQLTPAQNKDLVLAVSQEFLQWDPNTLNIAKFTRQIAEQMCEKYPSSLSDAALGKDDDGTPGSALAKILRSKVHYLRYTRKHKSRSSSSFDDCKTPQLQSPSVEVSNLASDSLPRSPTAVESSSPVTFDFGDFFIPWHKLDPSLLDCLIGGKPLPQADKCKLVNFFCDEFYQWYPSLPSINLNECSVKLAKKIVQMYPMSLSNAALGKKSARVSSSSLYDSLRLKFCNLKKSKPKPKFHKARGTNKNNQCFADDCVFGMLDWAVNFRIPWEKMPQELQESLKKEERLNTSLRSELVRIVSGDIQKIEESPNKESVDYIAEKMCSTYPKSLCDMSGEVVGNEHELLGREILWRIHRVNNDNTISVEEEIKEKKSVESLETSMPVNEEHIKILNTFPCPPSTVEVTMEVDPNVSTNDTSCPSTEVPIYDSSSMVLQLYPGADNTSSITNQYTKKSVTNTGSVYSNHTTTSTENQGEVASDCNTKSVTCAANVVPDNNTKSKVYPDDVNTDCGAKSEAFTAKNFPDCSAKSIDVTDLTKLVPENNTKSMTDPTNLVPGNYKQSKIYNVTDCSVKSEAYTERDVPDSSVKYATNPTILVPDNNTKSKMHPDDVTVGCSVKSEAYTTKDVTDCSAKSMANPFIHIPDNNTKSKIYQDNVNTGCGVKSATYTAEVVQDGKEKSVTYPDRILNPKENRILTIKPTVSAEEKNPDNNLTNEGPLKTYSDNRGPRSATNPSNVALNCSTTAAINIVLDDCTIQSGTDPSSVVSDCNTKSVPFQTDVVSGCNTKPVTHQNNSAPDCSTSTLILPRNVNSNYNPSPLTFPVNVVPNYNPPLNTVIQPSPMAYPTVLVPNYNTNPVTCWPPPVMAPNYNTNPMMYPSNIVQNCNTNDIIYMGSVGPNCSTNQMAYPVNPMNVNCSGGNTSTYQHAAVGSSSYNGYNLGVQYFQHLDPSIKSEVSEPDLRTRQTMQD